MVAFELAAIAARDPLLLKLPLDFFVVHLWLEISFYGKG